MKRSATSFPGKLALRFNSRLLARLAGQLTDCIIVTGTNGKTTTANLLGDILAERGPLIQNRAGSNMVQGIVSTLLLHTNWWGRLRVKTALFEVDEASLPAIASHLPIRTAVLTNVFRDQLDRYGELDTTLEKLIEGLRRTSGTVVVNADDPLSLHVALASERPFVTYGFADTMADRPAPTAPVHDLFPRDGAFCMRCGGRLEYDLFVYGQLGLYHCPQCGFERVAAAFCGTYESEGIGVDHAGQVNRYALPVRGLFNAYNALAAISAATLAGVSEASVHAGLARFRTPLGRMQPYRTNPVSVLNLVKNPTGADNVLHAVIAEPGPKVVCVAINDHAADGRDVSWLWDTQFELLQTCTDIHAIVTTGTRAEDMALRLKYAGFAPEVLHYSAQLDEGVDIALRLARTVPGCSVQVLSTYTALAPMAECLKSREEGDDGVRTAPHRASVS